VQGLEFKPQYWEEGRKEGREKEKRRKTKKQTKLKTKSIDLPVDSIP
jgi:hypothetical protein